MPPKATVVSEYPELQRIPRPDATLKELLEWGIAALAPLGSAEAKASAERLLEHAGNFRRSDLYLNFAESLSPEAAECYFRWIGERGRRVPTAYLTGKTDFWRETLEVGPGCLIPRPETETLIERFNAGGGFKKTDSFHFLDLCCGSGAIGIAILREYPQARGTFADLSNAALDFTRRNLARYQLTDRAEIICSDLFQGLAGGKKVWDGEGSISLRTSQCWFNEKPAWDVILCNPPYLSERDCENLQPELESEPLEALDGGRNGLDFYRRLAGEAAGYLKPGGWLGLEAGMGQAVQVRDLLAAAGCFHSIYIYQDDNAIDRVVAAKMDG